ncbi:MAG TPA: VOC family protein [Roseiflexaceae bacterium]|nr:VOC family protein [Roseiflexaceae bacterium]
MANERTYPCLPTADLDMSLAFYQALGFKTTYRQTRPNPHAVVALEDIQIHLFGMEGFHPADSYGTVIVVVPDPDGLYRDFATGLRAAYGKLPAAGIPRILRPRKKHGTVSGFSVVDPGGNWLRIYRLGESEQEDTPPKAEGLKQIVLVASRLGDARGDEAAALKTLENGLARYSDAPALDRAKAYLYRADLAMRLHNHELARSSLAEATAQALAEDERAALAEEIAYVAELVDQQGAKP